MMNNDDDVLVVSLATTKMMTMISRSCDFSPCLGRLQSCAARTVDRHHLVSTYLPNPTIRYVVVGRWIFVPRVELSPITSLDRVRGFFFFFHASKTQQQKNIWRQVWKLKSSSFSPSNYLFHSNFSIYHSTHRLIAIDKK